MLSSKVALAIIGILGVAAGLQNDSELLKDDRIVNGRFSLIMQNQYIASIQINGKHYCGGSILNTQWILTAAHCLETTRPDQASGIYVRMGSSDWRSGGVLKQVQEFHVHPQYNKETTAYDIAVIKLVSPVVFSATLKPIQMAKKEPADGTLCKVSGWGYTYSGAYKVETLLRETNVSFLSQAVCASEAYDYSIKIQESMVCGDGNGTDSCQGDSGGPLINLETNELCGVVSWGEGCALKGFPGVYSNVPFLRPWVMSKLQAW